MLTRTLQKSKCCTCAQVLREEFGSDAVSFYAADTFNEMAPPRAELDYLSSLSRAVYSVRRF
jgi:hypothetical protein